MINDNLHNPHFVGLQSNCSNVHKVSLARILIDDNRYMEITIWVSECGLDILSNGIWSKNMFPNQHQMKVKHCNVYIILAKWWWWWWWWWWWCWWLLWWRFLQDNFQMYTYYALHTKWECISQIARFMGPTWGPPGCRRPQMGPMLVPWALLSGYQLYETWCKLYCINYCIPSV